MESGTPEKRKTPTPSGRLNQDVVKLRTKQSAPKLSSKTGKESVSSAAKKKIAGSDTAKDVSRRAYTKLAEQRAERGMPEKPKGLTVKGKNKRASMVTRKGRNALEYTD